MNNILKGRLGWKGERGYSAYELAVKNGFIGSERDWLAQLGTSSHFSCYKTNYTTLVANENQLDLPLQYSSSAVLEVYVNGLKLDSTAYTIDAVNDKITLTTPLETVGTKVEIVVWVMATNELPIVGTITSTSEDTTVPHAKAVYDFVTDNINTAKTDLISNVASETTAYPSNKVDELVNAKFNKSNIAIVTGTINSISPVTTETTDANYPSGFTKNNCVVISKTTTNNNVNYDVDSANSDIEFPYVDYVGLSENVIRVSMTNPNTSTIMAGNFKIVLMKIVEEG